MCLFSTVSSRPTTTGARITSASALRSTEELRDVIAQEDQKVRLAAAGGSLSAQIQTSAIRAVAKLLATCGLGVWSAKKVGWPLTYIMIANVLKKQHSLLYTFFTPISIKILYLVGNS